MSIKSIAAKNKTLLAFVGGLAAAPIAAWSLLATFYPVVIIPMDNFAQIAALLQMCLGGPSGPTS